MGSTLVIQKDGSLSKSKVDRLWPPKRWNQGKVRKGFRDRLQPTFSAALPYCITPFCFLFFFDMRKPDIGSTVLISWGIWSTGPLACSLCWLFCHRFLHDWFPWQQRRCRPKQKTSWQCLWAETHEAEHLAKRCPQSNSMRLNETQWLQHYCQQFNYCNYCQLNCWTLQTLQAVLHTTWLPRASSASLTSFRLFWNSTARRALVWMLQVQVPHSP